MGQGWVPFSLAPQFQNSKGPHSELGSLWAGGGLISGEMSGGGGGLWQEGSAVGGAACPLGLLSPV